jgi:hypothetical protein
MEMNALKIILPQENDQAQRNFNDIVEYLGCQETCEMSESEIERELENKGRELMRVLLQEHLNKRSPGQCDQPVKDADGVDLKITPLHPRQIETVFGTVTVERVGYGCKGSHSLHPLDAELNLPDEKYSLEVRRRVAVEVSRNSFDETVQILESNTGAHVPKRQVEELVMRAAQDFDAFYDRRHEMDCTNEETGSVLVVSVDGKGVTMLKRDLRQQTRNAAEKRSHKMNARLSKGEKKNAKRMACVATVYTIAPFVRTPEEVVAPPGCTPVKKPRSGPEQKRVWASLEKEPEDVIADAFAEAMYRNTGGEKIWVALVDGNKPQIRYLKRVAEKNQINLTIIVDIIHVIEYLWSAGRAFHPKSGPELESWVQHRILEVLRGKAHLMAGGMRRSATLRGLSADARKPVDTCANYLLTYSPYLRYDGYLSQGLPIATGVIEGACRHLVKDRMDITGARWSLSGAEAVLKLRALRSSHDFEEYWLFHEKQEYERTHKALYADGIVPPTIGLRPNRNRTHLKVIK